MKKLTGLLMLIVLLFSVTTMLSAADLESVNPVEFEIQGTIETTILQNMGGVAILNNSERMALMVSPIQIEMVANNITMIDNFTTIEAVEDRYFISHLLKRFTHPAVLGVC